MSYDIKRVQKRLTRMAEVIEEILNAHGIEHMIMYGTLLGAVRHGGFIPWDDDFDFCIFDDRYAEAIGYLREELPSHLFLEDESSEPKFYHAWARVKDINSSSICEHYVQDNNYSHHGLTVDLFRMEKVKLKDLHVKSEAEIVKYLNRRVRHGLMDKEDLKKRLERLPAVAEYYWNYLMKDEDEKLIERIVYANYYVSRKYFEVKDVFPLKPYDFDGVKFLGPDNADGVLKRCYGDYMELPPEDKRIPHYSAVDFLEGDMCDM